MSDPVFTQPTTPTSLIKLFLSCVKSKEVTKMRALIHPNATAVLIRNNEPRFSSLDATIVNLENAEQELVEVTWDEAEHVDGSFATVWTKFSIHMDGELHQLGSSSYSCWKSPDVGWVIMSMSDIARAQRETAQT